MGCSNCNKNKAKGGTTPSKQNIRDLISKIKKERIKKDKQNG